MAFHQFKNFVVPVCRINVAFNSFCTNRFNSRLGLYMNSMFLGMETTSKAHSSIQTLLHMKLKTYKH